MVGSGFSSRHAEATYDTMDFSTKLRQLMGAQRLSQEQLAKLLGVSQNLVSLWTRGKSLPDVCQVQQVARALGASVSYLADDALDAPPESDALPDDERAVLEQYRALRSTGAIDKARAITGLAFAAQLPAGGMLTAEPQPLGQVTRTQLEHEAQRRAPRASAPKGNPEPRTTGQDVRPDRPKRPPGRSGRAGDA